MEGRRKYRGDAPSKSDRKPSEPFRCVSVVATLIADAPTASYLEVHKWRTQNESSTASLSSDAGSGHEAGRVVVVLICAV
jgi:hypothetical protein